MKNQVNEITSRLNIENRIFEDMIVTDNYQTEIFRQLDNLGITQKDIEIASFEFILGEELGIYIHTILEDDNDNIYANQLCVFLMNSIELGYIDYLRKKVTVY